MTDYVFKRKNRNKINPGDLFSFRLDDNSWGFGRIVSRITDGHVAEIFKYFANEPVLDSGKTYDRFMPPVVLDAYSLFQLKREGDWGFVGSTPDYAPDAVIAQVRFACLVGIKRQRIYTTSTYPLVTKKPNHFLVVSHGGITTLRNL
jgi:Immunity protein 26